MPDNVILASGALVVATAGDAQNVQHQKVVPEFLTGGGLPASVGTGSPLPTETPAITELLLSILVELRTQNSMIYAMTQTEVEPIELARDRERQLPITP